MRAAARRPTKAYDRATEPRGTGHQDYVPRAGRPDALPPLHAHRASRSHGQLLAVRLFRGGRDRRGGPAPAPPPPPPPPAPSARPPARAGARPPAPEPAPAATPPP